MLINVSHLVTLPILSLHVGGPVAFPSSEIVDPGKLKILGFYIDGPALDDPDVGDILDVRSIREISNLGMVVDSASDFVEVTDVIMIKKAAEREFLPVNKKVYSESGKKLGKVADYIVESGDFKIVDLIVKRPLINSLMYPEIFIPATEIVEVMNDRFIIRDHTDKIETAEDRSRRIAFTNPFREPLASTARTKNPGQQGNE